MDPTWIKGTVLEVIVFEEIVKELKKKRTRHPDSKIILDETFDPLEIEKQANMVNKKIRQLMQNKTRISRELEKLIKNGDPMHVVKQILMRQLEKVEDPLKKATNSII